MTDPQRQVRVHRYTRSDGTSVRSYTQDRDRGEDTARQQWQTKRWQAASAGMSVVIILAEVLVGVSEIAFAITLVILLGLNWLINTITKPRPVKPRRTVRRMSGSTARRRTKHSRSRR